MSALRPAFFILYLESYISRLNEILCHDLTLSVGEPDNAAAKQENELVFGLHGLGAGRVIPRSQRKRLHVTFRVICF